MQFYGLTIYNLFILMQLIFSGYVKKKNKYKKVIFYFGNGAYKKIATYFEIAQKL